MTEASTIRESGKVNGLIERVFAIRNALVESANSLKRRSDRTHPSYQKSARNLAHYILLRHHDIRPLQKELAELGLSSLGRAEAHVMATIDAVLAALHGLADRQYHQAPEVLQFHEGNELLRAHTEVLLGPAPANRSVRIMVTMPSEAASDYGLVRDLVARGMDCMRVNCSYDGPEQWVAMAGHLKKANRELGRHCRLSMDLAGPKIRVSALEPGPEVVKLRPRRNACGVVVTPARAWLVPATPSTPSPNSDAIEIPIKSGGLDALEEGDKLDFVDGRGSSRRFLVVGRSKKKVGVHCSQTAYLTSGLKLHLKDDHKRIFQIGQLPAIEQAINLYPGDRLILSNAHGYGRCEKRGPEGHLLEPAKITCTIPEIVKDVKAGERIWFDDGKIGGVIKSVDGADAMIEVTQADEAGTKLRGGKGINLPDSQLSISSLTPKDLRDLEVAVVHADIVGMSFVREALDVETLQAHLDRLGNSNIGLLLKIETAQAFSNLPDLMLAAMQRRAAGVMIARGDLAVECGYERLAEVQEEILWMCEAAHMPVVWATQVLESLAKAGRPSRAEITDAAMGVRAECVMLNKGPHLLEAVTALDNILQRMQGHQAKKTPLLRQLRSW